MFELVATTAMSSDCTCDYEVRLDKKYTVREFIETILTERSVEWGCIGIYKISEPLGEPRCEYKQGKLTTEPLPEEILNQEVEYVSSHGGWYTMNYVIITKETLRQFGLQNEPETTGRDKFIEDIKSMSNNEMSSLLNGYYKCKYCAYCYYDEANSPCHKKLHKSDCKTGVKKFMESSIVPKKMTPEKIKGILESIPMQQYLTVSVNIIYEEGNMSIGISHQDLEKYEGVIYKDIYIFNIFCGDEYINIDGEYRWKNNQFEQVEDPSVNVAEILMTEWNKFAKTEP